MKGVKGRFCSTLRLECNDGGGESESGYEADADANNEIGESSKALVELSFATLNSFLKGKLCKVDQQEPSQPPRKRRVYNNANRAAAAEARKAKTDSTSSRNVLVRNSEDTWLFIIICNCGQVL